MVFLTVGPVLMYLNKNNFIQFNKLNTQYERKNHVCVWIVHRYFIVTVHHQLTFQYMFFLNLATNLFYPPESAMECIPDDLPREGQIRRRSLTTAMELADFSQHRQLLHNVNSSFVEIAGSATILKPLSFQSS